MHEIDYFIPQAPQNCTRTTKNLLHFDSYSQRMYKCDGYMWRAWDTGSPGATPRSPIPAPSICRIGKKNIYVYYFYNSFEGSYLVKKLLWLTDIYLTLQDLDMKKKSTLWRCVVKIKIHIKQAFHYITHLGFIPMNKDYTWNIFWQL